MNNNYNIAETMKIYISGAISSDPYYKIKFYRAVERIRKAAGEVDGLYLAIINPAELPEGLSNEDYMMIDLQMIRAADAVIFLPDWTTSTGAKLEKLFCQYTGKMYDTLEHFEKFLLENRRGGHV